MSWKEDSEQSLFIIHKEANSKTDHKEINLSFNKNIWRYEGLGEIYIFMDGNVFNSVVVFNV